MSPLFQTEKSELDKAIDDIYREMSGVSADSDEYAKMVDQLVKLHGLKHNKNPARISRDTLATVVGNLVGIVLIVAVERENILTTKALNFLLKPKN